MNNVNRIVELAPIELADDVSEDCFIKASDVFQRDFLSKQRGFVKRDLLKDKDGGFIDLIYWESQEDAENVLKQAESSEVCHAYFAVMKGADVEDAGAGIKHLICVNSYDS